MARKSLGKGLDALIPGVGNLGARSIQEIDIQLIHSNPLQPRLQINDESLEELAQSIRIHGVLQPIIVRTDGTGYEIVAGERRWRAAQKAGLPTIPVIVEEVNEQKRLEIALIENLQREDLNPLDLAKGIQRLMLNFELTQEDISKRLGKKRPTIANVLRLLDLPQEIQKMLENNDISFGHARALLAIESQDLKIQLSGKIIRENLSVRDIEEVIRNIKAKTEELNPSINYKEKKIITNEQQETEITFIEESLMKYLATKVKIVKKRITIEYYGDEDLHRIYNLITGKEEPF
jgi:ParB family chromosome partitioning protein